MAYTIQDKNGNGYMDIDTSKQTVFMSLKCASEVLKDLPKGYWIKDTNTKKKVEALCM